MSSTGRGSERNADDFYATPPWAVWSVMPYLPKLPGLRILEPSAGRGAIVKVLLAAGADNANLVRVEVDRGRSDILLHDATPGAPEVVCADFMSLGPNFAQPAPIGGAARGFDLVVMNPPFSDAQAHVEHAISMLAPGGKVVALLRLAFCTSAKRTPFRKAHPFDMYPLASRPSFTAEALTWMTDADLAALAKTIKPKKGAERTETVDEVRSRLRGTDSAEYAWFVFHGELCHGMRPAGGRFSVLEDKSA